MPYAYLDRTSLKARLKDTLVDDDATYRAVLEAVSREIDAMVGRTFQPHTATRYYTAGMSPYTLMIDDLLTLTSIKTYKTSARDSQDTWAATDYDLRPFNAQAAREPYTHITSTPEGRYTWPMFAKGVEIVGVWGYWLDTLAVTTLSAAIVSTSATSITVASRAGIEPLMTLLVGSEQMYVTTASSTTLTVERGVNGTTAATHLDAAGVSVYRYPAEVTEAAAIQAARVFRRKDAPFGIAGAPEIGQTSVIPRLDPDVLMLLRRYRRYSFGLV